MIEPEDLINKECYINNKAYKISNIKKLTDNFTIAYYGDNGIINIELLRDKDGSYLYSKDNIEEMK